MKLANLKAPHMKYPVRFALLIVAVSMLDCFAVLFLKKPLPWAAMIPGLIPILVVPVVIMPMQREKKKN